jgi:hypothetical protein
MMAGTRLVACSSLPGQHRNLAARRIENAQFPLYNVAGSGGLSQRK